MKLITGDEIKNCRRPVETGKCDGCIYEIPDDFNPLLINESVCFAVWIYAIYGLYAGNHIILDF